MEFTYLLVEGNAKMTKTDLIKSLSKKQNITLGLAEELVELVFKSFSDELGNGGRIEIRGFGSFYVKEYGSYEGRNPKTGKEIFIKEKRLPVFKVGKELKKRVDLGI